MDTKEESSTEFLISDLEELANKTITFAYEADFHTAYLEIFKKLSIKDSSSLETIRRTSNFYVDIIHSIFKNEKFGACLLKVMEEESAFINSGQTRQLPYKDFIKALRKINVADKNFVHASLVLAFYPLMILMPTMSMRNAIFLRKVVLSNLLYLYKSQEQKFAFSIIVDTLGQIVNYRGFDNKEHISKIDDQKANRDKVRLVCQAMLIESSALTYVTDKFKAIEKEKTSRGVSVFDLGQLNKIVARLLSTPTWASETFKKESGGEESSQLQKFLDDARDRNQSSALLFLKEFSSNYTGGTRDDSIMRGLADSARKIESLLACAHSNLVAFTKTVSDEDAEWSNKILIICQRTLGVFNTINGAYDLNWKVKVFNRELGDWFNETYSVLNKYELEDDWVEIEKYLKEETDEIEWKSTFITPLEIDTKMDKGQILQIGKNHLLEDGIIKTMIAMMNTKGGSIIVGIVEKPEKIKRDDFKKYLLEKNGIVFFNTAFEMAFNNMNTDDLKRLIQEKLKKVTSLSEDKFNDLWYMQPFYIKGEGVISEIYKISINKSKENIYMVNHPWITLPRRANARTILINPREVIGNS